jgi:hypothetical protein
MVCFSRRMMALERVRMESLKEEIESIFWLVHLMLENCSQDFK